MCKLLKSLLVFLCLQNNSEAFQEDRMSLEHYKFIAEFMPIIREVCDDLNLDPNVISAIILTESMGQPCAMRFEPGWRWHTSTESRMAYAEALGCSVDTETNGQATSWGLMQVMGTVSRELGHRGWFTELCNPEVGIRYGAMQFKRLYSRVESRQEAIAAYNAGSVRYTKGGLFTNQRYVDKVMGYLRELER